MSNKRKGIRAAKVKMNFMTALPLSIQYEGVYGVRMYILHTYVHIIISHPSRVVVAPSRVLRMTLP